MKRVFLASFWLTLVLGGLGAQSTWRGQAELWQGTGAPTGGFVAASNDFTRNSVVTIENYKTKKTVQVRVVGPLPAGASAFILVSPKAATALAMEAGDSPLVGVQLDTSIASAKGLEEDNAVNPDPDVNLLAGAKPKPIAALPTPAPAPTPTETPTPAPTPVPIPAPTVAEVPVAVP
ncbi:MAG: hypothetical protein WCG80_18685, partial [Spirochaetales bacterium]